MYLSMKFSLALLFALFFTQNVSAKDLCLGTFSSLHFNREGGDVLGIEIKIVGTSIGKQAVVQFSEGEPGPLVVTPVTCIGSKISLKIPGDGGRSTARFNGVLSQDRLTGELVFDVGGRDKVVLMRRKSYWD